jgi:putative phosphoesterase
MLRFGIISDTHGRLDPAALKAFAKVDRIFHAGDIGSEEVLTGLEKIAPVTAIRGNNDLGTPLEQLPDLERIEIDGREILLIHSLKEYWKPSGEMKERLKGIDPDLVISGHSHKGLIEQKDRVIYFNPGGAGPKRFSLKRSIGLMEWSAESVRLKLIFLEGGRPISRLIPFQTL